MSASSLYRVPSIFFRLPGSRVCVGVQQREDSTASCCEKGGGLKRHDSCIIGAYPCLPFLTLPLYTFHSWIRDACLIFLYVDALARVRHAPTPGAHCPFENPLLASSLHYDVSQCWQILGPVLCLPPSLRLCTRVYILFEGTRDTRRHAPGPFHLRGYCASVENVVFSFVFRVVDGRRYSIRVCLRTGYASLLASRFNQVDADWSIDHHWIVNSVKSAIFCNSF